MSLLLLSLPLDFDDWRESEAEPLISSFTGPAAFLIDKNLQLSYYTEDMFKSIGKALNCLP